MRYKMLLLSILVLSISLTSALIPKLRLPSDQNEPLGDSETAPYPAQTINMPIDHFPNSTRYVPHETGTFKQRYFVDSTYYKPGGPVFLYLSGETDATYRFSNLVSGSKTIPGLWKDFAEPDTPVILILMQATNGIGVILENRYYGMSYPFNTSTTDNLRFLTTEQTIADNAYFAQHVTFPGVTGNLTAPGTPWILYGGSLAGGQVAFSMKTYGNIFFGGIASSAPTQTVLEYPEWYNPIQKFGPQDCISSINGIIEKIDHLVATENEFVINRLKALFGLEAVVDIRDFAQTIAFPLGGPFNYPTNSWQELNWYPGYSPSDFFNFCSNVTNINTPPNIAALDSLFARYSNNTPWTNLGNYANYIKETYLPLCPNRDYNSPECFGTQNGSFWAYTSNNPTRSYLYTTCTELGAYQVAPSSYPSLIMKVLKSEYTQQWCNWAFPRGRYNSIPPTPDLSVFNKYGGFNISADRLAFIDGTIDPWLDLCYHSDKAPPRISSDLHPEYLIAGAGHHWDSYGILDVPAEPLFIQQAHLWEIRTVEKWLKTFSSWRPRK